ncbi:MAG: polyribonucleotide nucleotidyltransferase, partial [Chloroflexi bacterium]|nr:polyribonucleotide nucleotidyltransferase [Chloroflexota bacterium]
ADYKIQNIQNEFSVGDEIMVMITDIDYSGKVRLSRQAVLEGWSLEEARQNDKGLGNSGGRGGRGGGGNRGGGNRDRGGGNRGGGGNRNRD